MRKQLKEIDAYVSIKVSPLSNCLIYLKFQQEANTGLAFCHWTYDVTDGYLLVVDIQV